MRNSYLYKYGSYPTGNDIRTEVSNSAKRLNDKLSELNIYELNISEYNRRYFGNHIKSDDARKLNLKKYGFVLAWALAHLDKPKEEIVFLDYGGGHGMLSLLAKEYGIGTVVHNDIYPVSCDDASTIAEALSLKADVYVSGDFDSVLEYFRSNNLSCDSVGNYDVIEHIYDIESFLSRLHILSDSRMSICLASAANKRNPRINRAIEKMHREFEYHDRAPREGRKPTDATRAILDLRRDIIRRYATGLAAEEVDQLALRTRGMIATGIESAVKKYLESGIVPEFPIHPTNTCDPYTGNWFEHLMDPDQLASVLGSTGFSVNVRCGYYDSPCNLPRRLIKKILNLFIRAMGTRGLYLSPYFMLSAYK